MQRVRWTDLEPGQEHFDTRPDGSQFLGTADGSGIIARLQDYGVLQAVPTIELVWHVSCDGAGWIAAHWLRLQPAGEVIRPGEERRFETAREAIAEVDRFVSAGVFPNVAWEEWADVGKP